MNGGSTSGYTILEVMIVLAVSGVMFLIAATFISGRTERASFTQGVNDLTSVIQKVAGEVNDGRYSDVPLRPCAVSLAGVSFSSVLPTQPQGTNSNCVYLGKLLYFYNKPGAGFDSPSAYENFTLVSAKNDPTTGDPITSIPNNFTIPALSLTAQTDTPQNIEIAGMHVIGADNIPYPCNYTLGFTPGLGSSDGAGGVRSSALTEQMLVAKQYSVVTAYTGPPSYLNEKNAMGSGGSAIVPAKKAELYLTDGARNALVTINMENDGLNVSLQFINSIPSAKKC